LLNVYLFRGVEHLSEAEKAAIYGQVYLGALAIPLISVSGVLLAAILKRREQRRLVRLGLGGAAIATALREDIAPPPPNWRILGGGLAFVAFSLVMGLSELPFGQEIIFAGSLAIVLYLMAGLVRALEPVARATLVSTAVVIFVFRAVPTPGPGVTWWMIDELGFDQQFLSVLSLTASVLTLFGMFIFRRFMADRSIGVIVGTLTIAGTLLGLPILGMVYGLHHWTAAVTGGIVDARFIALIDTALESPLGQIAMIPMLAWIANSAPLDLKATYFAVMASFTNLALSAAQLGTKYLNQIFTIAREVRDPATGAVSVAADYSQLAPLLWTAGAIGLIGPLLAIALIRLRGGRTA
jgi:hypothetical protein